MPMQDLTTVANTLKTVLDWNLDQRHGAIRRYHKVQICQASLRHVILPDGERIELSPVEVAACAARAGEFAYRYLDTLGFQGAPKYANFAIEQYTRAGHHEQAAALEQQLNP